MAPMDSDGGLPSTTRFIEPHIVAINQALANRPGYTVCGMGHSGGGWAIEVVAAIDTRMVYSASVFGGSPWGVKDWAWSNAAGWSQYRGNPVYGQGAIHLDRNRMAAQGRRAVGVFADGDGIYSSTGMHDLLASFAEQVNAQVDAFGSGEYLIWYDAAATTHDDWPTAAAWILDDIDSYLGP
jgi:hypothetical protein